MEKEKGREYSLTEIFSILIKRIWIFVLCIVLGTTGTFIISKFVMDKQYTATVSMYVESKSNNPDLIASISELNYAKEVVNTYMEILKTNTFQSSVLETSGLQYSPKELKEIIKMNVVNDTEIFQVQVTTNNPNDSFKLANTIAILAPQKIIEIKKADAVKVVDPAIQPTEPSAPNVILNTIIGFGLGLLVGVITVFTLEILDKRVKDEDDLLNRYKIPILGKVPIISSVIDDELNYSVLEMYKTIRTNLMFTTQSSGCKIVIISSAVPNEGKTTSCYNLGITLAQTDSKTLIIDCDLRKPEIHKHFNLYGIPGLSEVLAKMSTETKVIQGTEYPNLKVMCAGTIPPNPVELLGSSSMDSLLDKLSFEYYYILLDTPPINLLADTLTLSVKTDGVVMVIKQDKTTHPELRNALSGLEFVNAKVLGIILNAAGSGNVYVNKKYGYGKYEQYYGLKTNEPIINQIKETLKGVKNNAT